MRKVSVYLRSKDVCPSGYYRLLQYLYHIDGIDLHVHSLLPPAVYLWYHSQNSEMSVCYPLVRMGVYIVMFLCSIWNLFFALLLVRPTIVVIQRELLPRRTTSLHLFLQKRLLSGRTVIWDVDDNIWQSGELTSAENNLMCQAASTIIVTHSFLKNQLPKEFHSKVCLLPTTDGDMAYDDINSLLSHRKALYDQNELHLVWAATPSNLPYLSFILPTLDEAARQTRHQLVLNVVTSRPIVVDVKNLELRFLRWSHEVAINAIKTAHIGIMPLIEDEYTLGKGGFKLVQYMSAGLPVLGSDVGFNRDVVTTECGMLVANDSLHGWVSFIHQCDQSWQKIEQMSYAARRRYIADFSFEDVLHFWKQKLLA